MSGGRPDPTILGTDRFGKARHPEDVRFTQQTGIEQQPARGIDTTASGGQSGGRPVVEIVTADVTRCTTGHLRARQLPLLAA